jgi:sporulation protein YlmC with PRC-barrel domain
MPLLDDARLLKLPVHTKSGTHLGRVSGFEFEIETQAILRYRVRPKGLAARMLKGPLLVAREQVLSITKERMTVEDDVEKAVELEKAKAIGLVSNVEA